MEMDYDLIARIEIVGESNQYVQAYNARVEKLLGWNEALMIKDGYLFELVTKKKVELMVIESGIIKKTSNGRSSRRHSFNSCMNTYKVGQRLLLFAEQIEPGFYQSSKCSCTQFLEK